MAKGSMTGWQEFLREGMHALEKLCLTLKHCMFEKHLKKEYMNTLLRNFLSEKSGVTKG